MTTLRLILGDQLNAAISSLSDVDVQNDIILMCEVWNEATYVKHHKKKIAFIFSAMRHFANELAETGYNVHYTKLDDAENTGSFYGEVVRAIKAHNISKVIVTEPSEYRVLKDMQGWQLGVPIDIRPDHSFLCSHEEFESWAYGRKQFRMEYFYREMRKTYGILINGDQPKAVSGTLTPKIANRPKRG